MKKAFWIMLCIAYVAVPGDLISDFWHPIGQVDDLAVVVLTARMIAKDKGPKSASKRLPKDKK